MKTFFWCVLSVSLTVNAMTYWPGRELAGVSSVESQDAFSELTMRLNQLPVKQAHR